MLRPSLHFKRVSILQHPDRPVRGDTPNAKEIGSRWNETIIEQHASLDHDTSVVHYSSCRIDQ